MTRLALALALLTAGLGLRFGTHAASGADSYGYVSQADLWLHGTLIIDEPLAKEAPWRNANFTLAPLGYRPGDDRGTMVPTYAPGLPIVMAGLKAVAGEQALYAAVPLFGALCVWLTFLLGSRLGGPHAGLLAAVALLASPVFLYQLMWPMSDVPVTAWWLLSFTLAAGRGGPPMRAAQPALACRVAQRPDLCAAGAGLAAAAAILTRPNLAVLALPVIVLVALGETSWRPRLGRGLAFTLALLPGPIAVAVINNHLFQSPLASGYGTFSTIYAGRYFITNLTNYSAWLLETQTPFILLALAAPALLRARGDRDTRHLAVAGLGFALAVLASYLWYTPFDHWTYLRFLLPAYPMALAAAAAAFVLMAPQAPRRRAMASAAMAAGLVGWGLWYAQPAFRVRAEESRYLTAGRFATGLPDNAVILANQHSGSLRYYSNRVTLRFEWLDPDMYGQALDHMAELNRPVYAVLDDWEREVFRLRYAGVADVSWLDRPPLIVASDRVYFYAVRAGYN
ncbi:MAG: hypothetical protein EXQ53_08445 [Acidobacteria bacterium]|nr:hypothetical protein [Acidobacteriota bacterium]